MLPRVKAKIVQLVKQVQRGGTPTLEIGDLLIEKEWTFAGDIAAAMFTLVEQENVFEATIGSGETHTIKDWIKTCFSLINQDWEKHITQSAKFKPDFKRLVSDPTTINSLGWRPKVSFHDLAKQMIEA